MLNKAELDDMLVKLKDPSIDIITKNKIALSLSETKDTRVVEVLHKLIESDIYVNKRGTFVYCLLNFPSMLSFDLAINLIIKGNFEVAHTAFNIINNIENDIRGDSVNKAFIKLKNKIEYSESIEEWRKDLIIDVLEMFD